MTDAPRVASYGLELPSPHMIRATLARYVDDEEVPGLWTRACRCAGLDPLDPPARAEELLPLVDALEGCGDLAAVCAKGLRIRIMSYLVLSRSSSMSTAPVGL